MKNYYEILGITENSTPVEIKNAYRKLSLKHHPDRNKDGSSHSIFQELNEAYEILSDIDKKRQYDNELHPQSIHPDIENIFNMMFSGHPFHHREGVQLFGHPQFIFRHQKPERIQKILAISLEQSYHGCNLPIEIERTLICGQERTQEIETIYIQIPRGMDSNESILLMDKGHSINASTGDVRVIIQIMNTTSFKRNGLDLFYKKSISLKEALTGFQFELKHLNGQTFKINNTGQIIYPCFSKKIPDLGMIREGNSGHLWIEFEIEFPVSLTDTQVNTLKEIL